MVQGKKGVGQTKILNGVEDTTVNETARVSQASFYQARSSLSRAKSDPGGEEKRMGAKVRSKWRFRGGWDGAQGWHRSDEERSGRKSGVAASCMITHKE